MKKKGDIYKNIQAEYEKFCDVSSDLDHRTLKARKALEFIVKDVFDDNAIKKKFKKIRKEHKKFNDDLIRSGGNKKDKKYTYHDKFQGWYFFLADYNYIPTKFKSTIGTIWNTSSQGQHAGLEIKESDIPRILSNLNSLIEWYYKRNNKDCNFIKSYYEILQSASKYKSSGQTTKAGEPKLEIYNNKTFTQNKKFFFDNVKLSEQRVEKIGIKNGGGGTLEAEAYYNAKWVEVTPKKIHQEKLPQEITIKVDPSKDSKLKNGSSAEEVVVLKYISSGKRLEEKIPIKLHVEGHTNLVFRLSLYTISVSFLIILLALLNILNSHHFGGWGIFGLVVAGIPFLFGVGMILSATIDPIKRRSNVDFGLGAIGISCGILLLASWSILALVLTCLITWVLAKFLFAKFTFNYPLIAIIPTGVFSLFLLYFFTLSDLPLHNYRGNYDNNYTTQNNYNTNQQINRTGYISANEYANIRSGTSTNFPVITTGNRGEQLFVIERDNNSKWYKVTIGNTTGYISNKLVSFDYIESKSNENINVGSVDEVEVVPEPKKNISIPKFVSEHLEGAKRNKDIMGSARRSYPGNSLGQAIQNDGAFSKTMGDPHLRDLFQKHQLPYSDQGLYKMGFRYYKKYIDIEYFRENNISLGYKKTFTNIYDTDLWKTYNLRDIYTKLDIEKAKRIIYPNGIESNNTKIVKQTVEYGQTQFSNFNDFDISVVLTNRKTKEVFNVGIDKGYNSMGKFKVGHGYINVPVGAYLCEVYHAYSSELIKTFNINVELGVVRGTEIKKIQQQNSSSKNSPSSNTINIMDPDSDSEPNPNAIKPSSKQKEHEEQYRKAQQKAIEQYNKGKR